MIRSRPALVLTVPAVILASGLVFLSLLTGSVLEERDEAVRDGLLSRLGHVLETGLRESGPDGAKTALESFVSEHAGILSGAAVSARGAVIVSAGGLQTAPLEMPAALGPAWRGMAPPGAKRGFGMGGASGSPFRILLFPAPGVGDSRRLALAVVSGASAVAVALVVLALIAARNLVNRQRLDAIEAEHRRLETLALAGAGLAHKVRNPLAVIKGTAQMLESQLEEPARARASRIVASSERIEALLSRLLDFARPPERHPEVFSLEDVVREVAGKQESPLRTEASGSTLVRADRENLVSILEEFLANARSFDPEGELLVSVHRNEERAELTVADRGPGPKLPQAQLFEPYVTTRPEGTGLGLAIAKTLAEANGGEVSLSVRDGGGCLARLSIPLARS